MNAMPGLRYTPLDKKERTKLVLQIDGLLCRVCGGRETWCDEVEVCAKCETWAAGQVVRDV